MSWTWRLTYWTATIDRGTAPTRREAELAVARAEAGHLSRGLDPDGLAWFVDEEA